MPKDTFIQLVLDIIQQTKPGANAEKLLDGSIKINGRRLDTENLYRICKSTNQEPSQTISAYIDSLLSYGDFAAIVPWDDVKDRVMLRIQSNSIWKSLNAKEVAHTEWVNDCSIIYVLDYPEMTISITKSQMDFWGKTDEDLKKVALHNLDKITDYVMHLDSRILNNDKGEPDTMVMLYSSGDGYDSSRILLRSLWDYASYFLGGQFFACIPSRDILALCHMKNQKIVSSWILRNKEEFLEIPYPISPNPFVVTLDGIADWKPWP